MSTDHHAADAPGHQDSVAHHRTDDHGEDHGHDDHAHGDDDAALGPLDPYAWGAGLLGVGVAVVLAACLMFATSA